MPPPRAGEKTQHATAPRWGKQTAPRWGKTETEPKYRSKMRSLETLWKTNGPTLGKTNGPALGKTKPGQNIGSKRAASNAKPRAQRYSAVQCRAVQCGAVLCRAIQCYAAQCSERLS